MHIIKKEADFQGNKTSPMPKHKKTRTAPTNTSLLPPCKVCLEPAAGFHYGANTCEACKGFFRRSLLRKEEYKCHGDGNCNIRAGKRKICPKCRHQKCLAVGMSLEAVKTGRYTHAKRTQDILEYQQMMGLLKNSSADTFFPSQSSTFHCEHLGKTQKASSLTSASSTSSPASASTTSYSAAISDIDHLFDGSMELSAVEPASTVSQDLLGTFTAFNETASPRSDALSKSPCSGFVFPPDVCGSLTGMENRSGSLSATPISQLPSSTCSSVSACASSSLSSFCQSWSRTVNPDCLMPVPALSPLCPDLLVLMGSMEEDLECEEFVARLVKSHDQIVVFPSDSLTPAEMHLKMKNCYEACKLEQEVFFRRPLSEPEYQDIYQETGLDVDNRQPFVTSVACMLEQNIKRAITFIKTVPGFSQLPLRDQVQLIKDNRCEFRMMCSYHRYHTEWKVHVLPSGQAACIHQLQKLGKERCLEDSFQCATVLQKLGLSHEEDILLKLLIIFSLGRGDVEDWQAVSALQWNMARCLLWLLRRNRGTDGDRTFARIMAALCRVRELCQEFYDWIDSNPFENYSQFKNNGFLAEWFSSD